jgi:ribonucleotide reductase beta subunit family protein with ferritin-like domain
MKEGKTLTQPRITTPKSTYTFDYPAAVKFAETQREVFWLPDEINVEKDIQDLRVNMTEAERHGVITVLKLFTLYELLVGNEYWNGRVATSFPRPDIAMMANAFGFFEINVHAPFYNKLNEAMLLNTDEFYSSYADDEALKSRIDFVNAAADDENLLYSLATFSMLEGAVLYSSFAFLKSFQSQGKNLLNNVCRGINFSVRDENLHSMAGAWLFQTLLEESELDASELAELQYDILQAADHVLAHEQRIIEMIFEKGPISGITQDEMITFVKSRINLCLDHLGIFEDDDMYYVPENPVAEWFYKGINSTQFHDFFNGTGSEYNRNYDDAGFDFVMEDE